MLRCEGVQKSFGGLTAVNDVTFDLGDTPITGLVGPNGSGKTTLFHLITGFYRLDKGRVLLAGEGIHDLKAYRISRRGLARTFQHSRVLTFLSVTDNLLAAAPNQAGERVINQFFHPFRVRRQEAANLDKAAEIMDLLKLSRLADQPAGRLSYGQQKLLELGRVLMADPKIILLDEPTAGVNPTLIRQIVEVLIRLKDSGVRFFLVEHNMPLVAELCERLLVMDSGRLIFSGTPEEAMCNRDVIEAYLGKESDAA